MRENRIDEGRDGEDRAAEGRVANDREYGSDRFVNPFLDDEGTGVNAVLPGVDNNDPKWKYAWVRVSISGEFDTRNVQGMDPRLGWEPVGPDERPDLKAFCARGKHPAFGKGVVQVSDVVLYRCDKRLWQMKQDAYVERTRSKMRKSREDARGKFRRDSRSRPGVQVYEDVIDFEDGTR